MKQLLVKELKADVVSQRAAQ